MLESDEPLPPKREARPAPLRGGRERENKSLATSRVKTVHYYIHTNTPVYAHCHTLIHYSSKSPSTLCLIMLD